MQLLTAFLLTPLVVYRVKDIHFLASWIPPFVKKSLMTGDLEPVPVDFACSRTTGKTFQSLLTFFLLRFRFKELPKAHKIIMFQKEKI